MFRYLYLISIASLTSGWTLPQTYQYPQPCEPIKVPLCMGNHTKYGLTRLPNFMGDTEQGRIRLFTEQKVLHDLVKTNCSKDLVFFLCATLLPICVNDERFKKPPIVRPCRGLCNKVYADCISSMKKLNFQWPDNLNCSGLPDHATGMCIKPSIVVMSPKQVVKLKASCENKVWKKDYHLKTKELKKYDHVFRAKLTSSSHGKTKFRFSVQRSFTPLHSGRTLIYTRRCSNSRSSTNKKMFLILANKNNGDLNIKISVIAEWKRGYWKVLRRHATNMQRRGTKSGKSG